MGNKVKVLMVAGSMNVGGIENQLMHLLRNADKEKFQFDFTSDDPEAFYKDEIEALGGRCILIPKMNWKNPLPYCKKMFSIIKDGKYDVVHSHELFHSGITLFIAYIAGVPCRFVHAHNWRDDDGTERRTERNPQDADGTGAGKRHPSVLLRQRILYAGAFFRAGRPRPLSDPFYPKRKGNLSETG